MGVDGTPGSGRALRLDPFALPARYAARDRGADGQIRQIELDRDRVVLMRAVRGIPMKLRLPVNAFRGVTMRTLPPGGRRARRRRGRARTSRQRPVGAAVRCARGRRGDGAVEGLGTRAWRAAARGRGRRLAARAVPAHGPASRSARCPRAASVAPRTDGAGPQSSCGESPGAEARSRRCIAASMRSSPGIEPAVGVAPASAAGPDWNAERFPRTKAAGTAREQPRSDDFSAISIR